ncbi:hypothetical protein [Microvirga aerophila]|uniref:Uncharacterized protein n=1 Tax=Microvirga aerophila TaxID=670291 RepID=A0A512C2B5_9HYPH|nr:hypothetical protein [Microvirga aerophila]GEO18355.1 hypothetical protein MAE02_60510 [Microvirga aerophila]
MQDLLEDIVQTVGGALVAPGLGSAELVLAMLVAFGFFIGAIYSIFARGDRELEWWER